MYGINKITMGDTVKDCVTHFKGVVTGYIIYSNGREMLQVSPQIDKDGKFQQSEWIELHQLFVAGDNVLYVSGESKVPEHMKGVGRGRKKLL